MRRLILRSFQSPGDVLMLILGLHARQGTVPLWQAVAVTWLGTMIGSTFLYFLSRMAGRDRQGGKTPRRRR